MQSETDQGVAPFYHCQGERVDGKDGKNNMINAA
jgi:hypothetical protein